MFKFQHPTFQPPFTRTPSIEKGGIQLLRPALAIILSAASFAIPLRPQSSQPTAAAPADATLQINSRAVLVDVIVTDRSGKPVTGLKRDAFTVNEQGKPQSISFFEEHSGAAQGPSKEMPKLPPDVFSNFSPFPDPPAVNVLLLDSLNTQMENQSQVHQQAMKFLKTAKPGTRMAIFAMDLGLHYIQGFTDDPTLLLAALNKKKNNEVQSSALLPSQQGGNANADLISMMNAPAPGFAAGTVADPVMTAALQNFMQETDTASTADRSLRTLENLQRLATFLSGFPGRKNVIWFSESFPLTRQRDLDPQIAGKLSGTMASLAAARVALYPVDSRGVKTDTFYQAGNNLPSSTSSPYQIIGVDNAPPGTSQGNANTAIPSSDKPGDPPPFTPGSHVGSLEQDDQDRATSRYTEEELARETGGKAFVENNGLAQVIEEITSSSANFYTLSYVPTDEKMDGRIRKIEVKVPGSRYNLSYRTEYPATDQALPGSSLATRAQEIQKLTAQNPKAVDPLLPFMDLGMPQSEQVLYKVMIQPATPKAEAATVDQNGQKSDAKNYGVDFAVDLKDLDLKLDSVGLHKGVLNVSLIAYDRYGHVVSRKDFIAPLNIKPDAYTIFEHTGVQLHAEMGVPKGQYWLRTGVYDQQSGKVGTMEVALSSVVALPVSLPDSTTTNGTMGSGNAKVPALVPPPAAVPPVRAESVTVEQLEHALADAHAKRDQDLAKRLGGMQLTERLSSPRLAKIEAAMPGEKSRMALLALADASAFLQLPAAEIPATAPPDSSTQNLILSRAAENLEASIAKLPDFYARQTTTRFHDMKVSHLSSSSSLVILEHQPFQTLDSISDTVYYRDGKEAEEASPQPQNNNPLSNKGLVNWGVFGQLQRIVVTDIYKGKMEWSHWEQGAAGPVAVFRYSIPREESNYVVNYCCFTLLNQPPHTFQSVPPFHGEIAIDPDTGAVYRLVIVTELSPADPIVRAEQMVEYEPVEIGGHRYVCPRKSVTISTAIDQTLYQGCWDSVSVAGGCLQPMSTRPKDTAINDIAYDSYHVFRSEARMLPPEDTVPPKDTDPAKDTDKDQKPPADVSAPTSTAPRP